MIRNYLKNNDISIRDDTDANSIMQLYDKGNKASIVPLMKSIKMILENLKTIFLFCSIWYYKKSL